MYRKTLLFKLALASLFFSVSNIAYSANFSSESHFVLSENVGPTNLSVGDSQIEVSELETDTLHQTNNGNVNQFSFGVGYAMPLNDRWFTEIKPMLNFYYFTHVVAGRVYRYEDPLFDNYQYEVSLNSSRLMLDVYLNVLAIQRFSLFILGGVGDSWNRVGYQDKPIYDVPNGGISLVDQTNNGFVWEGGAGLAYSVQENFEIYVQYLYTKFKEIQTADHGRVNDYLVESSPIGVSPAQFSLHSQAILFGLNIKL